MPSVVENLYEKDCVRTNSGMYVNLVNPDPDTININDIAHALSCIPRFNGHTRFPYSVAQHSLMVCNMLPPEDMLTGLLHDASEAYICDIPSPLKKLMPSYYELEEKIMMLIADKFKFRYPLNRGVIQADRCALEKEWKIVFLGEMEAGWSPQKVKHLFLSKFYELSGATVGKSTSKWII